MPPVEVNSGVGASGERDVASHTQLSNAQEAAAPGQCSGPGRGALWSQLQQAPDVLSLLPGLSTGFFLTWNECRVQVDWFSAVRLLRSLPQKRRPRPLPETANLDDSDKQENTHVQELQVKVTKRLGEPFQKKRAQSPAQSMHHRMQS
ncbi:Ribonuclease H1 [Sciurus carolinensis]|uniref:Ribonuclease H1 n=1 Tax=Sciurus carolinensis TaxID=30640 RepID=A0AA41N8Y8_SCICA|nr:Ribonuclease H1 [Sciurus carolinensis]